MKDATAKARHRRKGDRRGDVDVLVAGSRDAGGGSGSCRARSKACAEGAGRPTARLLAHGQMAEPLEALIAPLDGELRCGARSPLRRLTAKNADASGSRASLMSCQVSGRDPVLKAPDTFVRTDLCGQRRWSDREVDSQAKHVTYGTQPTAFKAAGAGGSAQVSRQIGGACMARSLSAFVSEEMAKSDRP